MIDYNKRLAEVSVILNHLSKSDYDKIPKEVIDNIERNKDTEYFWNYDETKDLKEQNVSKDTIALLSYLNMKYLLNEEQRSFLQRVFNENQEKIEIVKKEKYDPDNIFKNKFVYKEEKDTSNIIVVKEERWYKKIIKLIKNLFRRK